MSIPVSALCGSGVITVTQKLLKMGPVDHDSVL